MWLVRAVWQSQAKEVGAGNTERVEQLEADVDALQKQVRRLGAVTLFREVILLVFDGFATRSPMWAPIACGEPNEIDLTAASKVERPVPCNNNNNNNNNNNRLLPCSRHWVRPRRHRPVGAAK